MNGLTKQLHVRNEFPKGNGGTATMETSHRLRGHGLVEMHVHDINVRGNRIGMRGKNDKGDIDTDLVDDNGNDGNETREKGKRKPNAFVTASTWVIRDCSFSRE